ncbi:hypothetical protein C0991_007143 [Blastosporella zonata]|nr:hypothetical protein C0991_007143 [Blastosporella zonata]
MRERTLSPTPEPEPSHPALSPCAPLPALRKRRTKASEEPGYVARPSNSFILWRKEYHKPGSSKRMADIGQIWKSLPAGEQAIWTAKAEVEKEKHTLVNPGYKFNPNHKKKKKKKKKEMTEVKEQPLFGEIPPLPNAVSGADLMDHGSIYRPSTVSPQTDQFFPQLYHQAELRKRGSLRSTRAPPSLAYTHGSVKEQNNSPPRLPYVSSSIGGNSDWFTFDDGSQLSMNPGPSNQSESTLRHYDNVFQPNIPTDQHMESVDSTASSYQQGLDQQFLPQMQSYPFSSDSYQPLEPVSALTSVIPATSAPWPKPSGELTGLESMDKLYIGSSSDYPVHPETVSSLPMGGPLLSHTEEAELNISDSLDDVLKEMEGPWDPIAPPQPKPLERTESITTWWVNFHSTYHD